MPEDKSPSTLDLLKQVCDIMENHDLAEVYLREGEVTLRVRRSGTSIPGPLVVQPPSYMHSQTGPTESNSAPSVQLPHEVEEVIKSPMLGRFYRAPNPDQPPYVEEGDTVAEETVLCQIEAMKIFNDIPAPFSCEILEILAEDDTPVEYDQPLFRVRRT
ncbi:MAG: acetyl-CoA carboxylase biotin carboxyl carrier protein [Candidatus Poribacteria bacterium]